MSLIPCLCADFDLCSSCLTVQPETIGSHARTHDFFAIEEPGSLWVHAVFSDEDRPEPSNQPANEGPPEPSTSSEPIQEQNALADNDVIHNATCDLCSSAIKGDRFVSAIHVLCEIKFLTAPRNVLTAQISTSALRATRLCLLNILVTALPAYAVRRI